MAARNAKALQADVAEIRFCACLDELFGEDVTQGDTTREKRRELCRELIVRNGAGQRPVGRRQTLAEAFERVYGEPLFHVEHHENNDGV